jgi:predicted aspartyl protease
MQYPYDKNYSPPAPVIEFIISSLEGKESRCKGLIDTGVSMTCIPKKVIEVLGLPSVSSTTIKDFEGHTSDVAIYLANILLLNFNIKTKVLPIDSEIGLIGRDILNQMAITLDGKNLVLEIEQTK